MPAPWETKGGDCLQCGTEFNWYTADDSGGWEKHLCSDCGWDPENHSKPTGEAWGSDS
jgi:hypothetical protein